MDDLGLLFSVLHSYILDFAKQTGLSLHFTSFAQGRIEKLDSTKRTVLYRVAQEALANVAKHAEASEVNVSIEKLRGVIRMEVKDNGKSFQVQDALRSRRKGRLGLLGMRERVEMVGGRFSIEAEPNEGHHDPSGYPVRQGASEVRSLKNSVGAVFMKRITVLLAEDHMIVREGLRVLLEAEVRYRGGR